jgi:phage shock protein E
MHLRQGFILIAVLLIGVISYAAYDYAHNSRFRISAAEAKELLRQKQFNMIVDVRTGLERETLGFYPNSIHIPAADLEEIMPTLYPNRNAQILLYCNTGQRARRAADILHELGYKKVFYIAESHITLM